MELNSILKNSKDKQILDRIDYLKTKNFNYKLLSQIFDTKVDEKTFFISTGHQAVLEGGPLYVSYKALTTAKFVKELSIEYPNYKFLPFFWLAEDDDDILEVIRARNPETNLVTSCTPIDKKMTAYLEDNNRGNWSKYHRTLLENEFNKFGIKIISPLDTKIRNLRNDFFKTYTKNITNILNELYLYNNSLKEKQVNIRVGNSLLYKQIDSKRVRLELSNIYTLENYDNLLTSVLTRLVSLETSLPLLIDVCGPGELKYHKQSLSIYKSLNRQAPLFQKRFSATLKSKELTKKEVLSLNNKDVDIESQILATFIDTNKIFKFKILSNEFLNSAQFLSNKIQNKLNKSIAKEIKNLEKEELLKVKISKEKYVLNILNAIYFVFPSALQERIFSFMYFVKTEKSFLENIYKIIDPFNTEHKILEKTKKNEYKVI